jgi:hypothetical protein
MYIHSTVYYYTVLRMAQMECPAQSRIYIYIYIYGTADTITYCIVGTITPLTPSRIIYSIMYIIVFNATFSIPIVGRILLCAVLYSAYLHVT